MCIKVTVQGVFTHATHSLTGTQEGVALPQDICGTPTLYCSLLNITKPVIVVLSSLFPIHSLNVPTTHCGGYVSKVAREEKGDLDGTL